MLKNNTKMTNILILVLGISIIGSLIFMVIGNIRQKDKLQVYTGDNVVENVDATEAEKDIKTNTYVDDDNIFSIQIPDGWERVVHGNDVEFIHSPSATSVKISVKPYDPLVTIVDSAQISARVVDEGYSFVSCGYITDTSSEVIYQKNSNAVYDFIEETMWSKDYSVQLLFTVNDQYYDKMLSYLDKILTSFKWDESVDTFPEGYKVNYIEYGDFEFIAPDTWAIGSNGNSIVCYNEDNTAQIAIQAQEFSEDLSKMTTYELSGLIMPGRESGFMITNSNTSLNKAFADCVYLSSDGINMCNKTYLFVNGYYMYSIQFDYVSNSIDESIPDTCSKYFREFITKKIQEEMEREERQKQNEGTPSDASKTDASDE